MEVKELSVIIRHYGKKMKVQLSVFKPDEHTRYRATIDNDLLGKNMVLMMYRNDAGDFYTYETDYDKKSIAKSIAEKVREAEKSAKYILYNI